MRLKQRRAGAVRHPLKKGSLGPATTPFLRVYEVEARRTAGAVTVGETDNKEKKWTEKGTHARHRVNTEVKMGENRPETWEKKTVL